MIDIIIGGIVIAAMLAVIIYKIVKSARGEGGCSGCSGCPSSSVCHSKTAEKKIDKYDIKLDL